MKQADNMKRVGSMRRVDNIMIYADQVFSILEIFPEFDSFNETQKDLIGYGIWCVFRKIEDFNEDLNKLLCAAKAGTGIMMK